MTFGEKAVGLSFNPSGDDAVAQCKKEFAVVIDRMNEFRAQNGGRRPCNMAAGSNHGTPRPRKCGLSKH